MVTHTMITFLSTVKFLTRILTQKLTCKIITLKNITLNGITFPMTKKRYTVKTLMNQLFKCGLMYFPVISPFGMTLPINENLIIFTVSQLKASVYQLFLLIKGQKTVADKPHDGNGTAETCMLMAGNSFQFCVEMVVRVIMNFLM